MALVCAAAFLLVGLAHSTQHFAGSVPAVQLDAGADDGGTEPSSKTTIAVDHCHGCAMTAMTAAGPPLISSPVLADHPPAAFDGGRPHPPVAETPPPIDTI
jgi:hypothetical protein